MRVNYTLVGGFTLAMLFALVATVMVLTGQTGDTDPYVTEFPNVTGLKYGTQVTYEGYVIGQVEKIDPLRDPDGIRFRVRLSVRRGWPIPADSVARVAASGLLAAVIVDIQGGHSTVMLAPGAEIPSGSTANLFARLGDMAGQMNDLNQTALKPLLQNLNGTVSHLNSLLDQNAPTLLANLIAISGDLAQKTPRITADVARVTDTLASRVVTPDNAARLTATLDSLRRLSLGLEDSRRKLDSTLAAVDGLVGGNRQTVDASLRDLHYTLQTMARSIDSLTGNMEETTRNLNEFSRQVRDNPGVLLRGRNTADGPGSVTPGASPAAR